MTRKRFVRLIMAARIDRNRANMLADDVKRLGIPYALAHQILFPALYLIKAFDNSGDPFAAWLSSIFRKIVTR